MQSGTLLSIITVDNANHSGRFIYAQLIIKISKREKIWKLPFYEIKNKFLG